MENDLIRRGVALKELWYPFDFDRAKIDQNIRAIPAVDAVEVVRCIECSRRYAKDFGQYCPVRVGPVRPAGYCDEGRRRKDGDGDG